MAKAGTGDRIRWFCVDCGKRVKARPEHAGNQFKCPFCENMSKVPHTSEPGAVRDKAVSASAGKERKKIVEHKLKFLGGGDPDKQDAQGDANLLLRQIELYADHFTPRLIGTETIEGRPAYVLQFLLNPDTWLSLYPWAQ